MFNIRSVLRIAQPRLSQSLPKASYHWRIDDFALALLTPEFTIDVQKKVRGWAIPCGCPYNETLFERL